MPKSPVAGDATVANAKSHVDVGDGLRDCTTENIHTRNTLVIGFRQAILR